MLTKGYTATSVDEVCAAPRLTKGTFFHYFRGKDDLGKSVAEQFYATAAYDLKKLRGKTLYGGSGRRTDTSPYRKDCGRWPRWWSSEIKQSSPCWRPRRSYDPHAAAQNPRALDAHYDTIRNAMQESSRNWGWPLKKSTIIFSGFALKRLTIESRA